MRMESGRVRAGTSSNSAGIISRRITSVNPEFYHNLFKKMLCTVFDQDSTNRTLYHDNDVDNCNYTCAMSINEITCSGSTTLIPIIQKQRKKSFLYIFTGYGEA